MFFKTLPIIIVLITYSSCQKLEISNLNDQPLLTLRLGNCKIQTGIIRVIHPINITDLEITVNLLTNTVYQKTNNYLSQLAKHKVKELYNNFLEIRSSNHRGKRSLESIGTAWKWIGGSPDATDLRIINKTMNELIVSNNQQYKVNEQIGNRLKAITKAINEVIESKAKNKIILDEMDTIITIMKIDMINKILEDIAEAITLSKMALTSSKVLSPNEISVIKSILDDQGVRTDLPDEALNLVKPVIAVNEKTLLYIINIPQVNQEEQSMLRIIPVTKNGQIITQFPKFLIKWKENLYSTTQPYEYIQRSTYIAKFSDNCIEPLINGKTGKCSTKESSKTDIRLLTDDLILLDNAKNDLLRSNCGPDDRNLTGNILITFSNCSIHCRNQTFLSNTKITNTTIIQGAMHNLLMDQQPEQDVLQIINNMAITNRQKIDHVYLMQFDNKLWDWSLLGGISISMILTITISVFAFLTYRKSFYKIISKIARKRKAKTPTPTDDKLNQDA